MTVVLTDVKYRMSLAAIRDCLRAGHTVILVHRDDGSCPLGFYTKGDHRDVVLPSDESAFLDGLLSLLSSLSEPAVLLPIGGETIDLVAKNRPSFDACCRLLLADTKALSLTNDKARIRKLAKECGLSVPDEFWREDDESLDDFSLRVPFPCVIKYVCGEKLGLSAPDRYAIAKTREDFLFLYTIMQKKGPVLVQRYIEGEGMGICLLMSKEGELLSFLCHRRVREYPVSGGPSTCAESIFRPDLVEKAAALLRAAHFVGPAMVEFKGDTFLEINPRLWGSFPLTRACGAPFTLDWILGAAGETLPITPKDCRYEIGVKMRFAISDMLSFPGYLRRGEIRRAFSALFRGKAKDGLFERGDFAVTRAYLRSLIGRL